MTEIAHLLRGDVFDEELRKLMQERALAAGPEPAIRPTHMIEDATWPVGALSLCERGAGDVRPPEHGWHFYADHPRLVTCTDCLEWMHA